MVTRRLSCGLVRLALAADLLASAATATEARTGAPPLSHVAPLVPLEQVAVLELPAIDRAALLAEDEAAKVGGGVKPLRFASPADIELSLADAGTWERLADGSWLWRLRVHAPGATDLNFGFTHYRLAEDATLHVWSEDFDYVEGPYTAADASHAGDLWTPVVPGERAVVELHEPAAATRPSELVLGRVGRGYRDLFRLEEVTDAKAAWCNVDAVCPEGDGWRDEIRSVARISISGMYLCSGTLIRDVPSSFTPYFLTAYHCEVRSGTASSVVAYWNFESPVCGMLGGGSLADNQTGSIYRAGRQDNDFCLIELEEDPDSGFGVYFAGWDARTATVPQGTFSAHHPTGDEKMLTLNDDPLTTIASCIVSGPPGTHWEVADYEAGTTEGGSSGSALWDAGTHMIVGYLSGGGGAACSSPINDCYGKFAVGWDGSSASARLRDWLDPASTGTRFVAGSDPGGGGCTYSIDPGSASFTELGGDGLINVVTDDGCPWSAVPTANWITITGGASGDGSGTVSYHVDPNPDEARSGAVTIASEYHFVDQASGVDACVGDHVHDDGTAENAYGWGTGNLFVQRFTPEEYPYVFSRVCVALTQAAGDTSLNYSIVVYDAAPGGQPGTSLVAIPTLAGGVPLWFDTQFYSTDVTSYVPPVDEGSVYIGLYWNDAIEQGFYVAADESSGTVPAAAYYSSDGSPWTPVSTAFPAFRALLIRAEGESARDGQWLQVVGGVMGDGNGFGNPGNLSVDAMAEFEGALYVGTTNYTTGGEVFRSTDGTTWTLAALDGFGVHANRRVSSMAVFNGLLYAGTTNSGDGCGIYSTTDGTSWDLRTFGFGDGLNQAALSMRVFGSRLYVGTRNTGGCEIWRSLNGDDWSQVHVNGFGDAGNVAANALAEFAGRLYVGTENSITGAEVWRSSDGVAWFQVSPDGFGTSANTAVTSLAFSGEALYAAVSNLSSGAEVWRTYDGTSWSRVAEGGFGDPGNSSAPAIGTVEVDLFVGTSNVSSGGSVWHTATGTGWQPDNTPGFGDPGNESLTSIGVLGSHMYVGTQNDAGCEVWRRVVPTVFLDGFESGDTSAWSATVP